MLLPPMTKWYLDTKWYSKHVCKILFFKGEKGRNSSCHHPRTYSPSFWTETAKTYFSGRGANSSVLLVALPLMGVEGRGWGDLGEFHWGAANWTLQWKNFCSSPQAKRRVYFLGTRLPGWSWLKAPSDEGPHRPWDMFQLMLLQVETLPLHSSAPRVSQHTILLLQFL